MVKTCIIYTMEKFKFAVLSTDVVILKLENEMVKTLLIQAKTKPFSGKWALPGGLIEANESLETASDRFVRQFLPINKTAYYKEQLYSFGDPKRDPNGRVVSVAYLTLIASDVSQLSTTKEYPVAAWFPVSELPTLAYDHKQILETGLERLKNKIKYTNLIYTLMPKTFTLTELQKAYETIWGKMLDKRNFRKKMIAMNLVKPTEEIQTGTAHRPAQLYTFTQDSPQIIDLF